MTQTLDHAQLQISHTQLKTGLWLCWVSLFALPVGLLAIGGGPCAGPNNAIGSTILLIVGSIGVGGGLFGIFKISRGIKEVKNWLRVAGALSVVAAGFACLGGAAYLFIGYQSLRVFLQY
jgi:hypothetical protein